MRLRPTRERQRQSATVPAWGDALPSRRERVELKRGSILREAAQSFNRTGFHGTSMDDIARRLGVTKAALYRYIPNKHELLFASFNLAMDSSFANLERGEREGANSLDKLRIALRGYLEDLIGKLGHPVVLLEDGALLPDQARAIVRRRDEAEKRYRSLVKEGIADGSIVPCDPKLAVFALLGAINWVPKWYRADGEWSAAQIAESLVNFITRSIAVHPESPGVERRSGGVKDGVDSQQRHATRRKAMKRFRMLRRALVVVAVLGLTATAAHEATAQGVTDKVIKIGAYNALTGPIPLTGKQMTTGWQAAVQAINEAGGIHGRKLELVVEDDGYEPSRAMAAARKLVERDQVLLMTGLGTPTTVVTAKYLEQAKVPLLFPMGASSTQLNEAGLKQLFMVHPAYLTQAEIIVGWMLDHTGVKKPCLVYQLDPAGEDHLAGMKKVVQSRNMQIAAAEGFERGTTDFAAPALKAKNAGCDMVYTAMTLEAAARLVTASDRMGFKPKFAGFTTQADATLIKLLGPLAEGFYAADMLVRPDSNDPAVKGYLANLKKFAPDAEPTFFTTYAYAAMLLIGEAIKDAGNPPTREKVLAALEKWNPKNSGLMGPVVFAPNNHDGKRSLYIIQVKGGKWEKVSDWLSVK